MSEKLRRFPSGSIHPVIRIQKMVLTNFKNVSHGEIVFPCGKDFVEQGTHSDILGIYGQNGSGKTAAITAISVLKDAMSDRRLDPGYSRCIAVGAEYSQLEFTFDFQYPEPKSSRCTITYEFKISRMPVESDSSDKDPGDAGETGERVRLYDETIYVSGLFDGEIQKKQILITGRDSKSAAFGPVRKIHRYIPDYSSKLEKELLLNKSLALKSSKSALFLRENLDLLCGASNYSELYLVLAELNRYAVFNLQVIDTRVSEMKFPSVMMFSEPGKSKMISFELENTVSDAELEGLNAVLGGINSVLSEVIPRMNLIVRETGETFTEDGIEKHRIKVFSDRSGIAVPLVSESAGLIKIISIMSVYTSAFNNPSYTVAIDEFDSGIYEFLLGELLTMMDEHGKGQLIFTSHNLRPLELLSKNSLVFTTANPDNRYVHIKGVARTNNLRDLYLREITENGQQELMYDSAKRDKIVAALKKAGQQYAK